MTINHLQNEPWCILFILSLFLFIQYIPTILDGLLNLDGNALCSCFTTDNSKHVGGQHLINALIDVIVQWIRNSSIGQY